MGVDLLLFLCVIGAFTALTLSGEAMHQEIVNTSQISLDPSNLPYYAIRTLIRVAIALVISILFSVIYASLAAKSSHAESVLIPLLDILQSVPILGYLSFTVVFFLGLFPGNIMGAELAAIFAIFTSQVWNITFSFYQSLKAIPIELLEVGEILKMSKWQKFWVIELPYSIPGLVWNSVLSISGSWFFVVASEAISIGDTKISLEGIGAYIALAIQGKDLHAIAY